MPTSISHPCRREAGRNPLLSVAVALFAFIMLACALGVRPAGAQEDGGGIVGEQRAAIEAIASKNEELQKELESGSDDDARLVSVRNELQALSDQLLEAGLAFRPRLKEINARLEQLGPAPAEGQPKEPAIVSQERDRLLSQKAEINALIGKAENLSLRVNRRINGIAEMRRDLFSRTLSKRYDINLALIGEVWTEFGREMAMLGRTVEAWLRYVVMFKPWSAVGTTLLALLSAAILFFGGRRVFGSMIEPNPLIEQPSYLSRLSVAFWSTMIPTVAFSTFLGLTYFFYRSYGVLRDDIATILWMFFNVVATVFFVHRLASATLSPAFPQWRLSTIETRPARILVWLVTLMAAIMGLDVLLSTVSDTQGAPLSLAVGKSLFATVLIGLLVEAIALLRPFPGDENHPKPKRWPRWFRYLLYLLGGMTIVAGLLGYIGLSRFLSRQIVMSGAILTTMYVGFLSARALAAENAFLQTALGARVQQRFALEDKSLDQLALATSILINLLVMLWGFPLILLQWGFQWGDMRAWILGVATEIHVGSVSISLVGIFTGVLVFVIGFLLTRWFQSWLDGSVMSRGRVDTGVRNSIRTSVGYAGIALAILIGISAAGIDLSSLALVAGALSLGIGFGLQNIVSNFVSGLILLAERPFKAGDWIVAGTVTGFVKKISVRATEIETFQRQTVILPNSELINAAVGNWTHKNALGRIEIVVRVAHGSDVRRVHQILLAIAREHPLVLKNPDPFVLFSEIGEYSHNFEIRLYLADILSQLDVMNDIRFAVVEAFEKEGIEIPVPQRELYIKQGGRLEADGAGPVARPQEQPTPAG